MPERFRAFFKGDCAKVTAHSTGTFSQSLPWEQVFKGERDGAYEVAIKIFNATGCTEEEANILMNEISLLRSCRHSNIVQVGESKLRA
jgi:hypothetical protein